MSKTTRYTRWSKEDSRRGRRARFRIQEREPMTFTQNYSMTIDVEELTDPPVYTNTYTRKPRWRDVWTEEAPEEDTSR